MFMIALNIAFSFAGIYSKVGESWTWDGRHGRFTTELGNRVGALAIANAPLAYLYSGRNNFLLYLTSKDSTLSFGL